MEYTLYCDESVDKGSQYGDFFGGCLVSSSDLRLVEQALNVRKVELNMHGEIKWTKVTAAYLAKYTEMMRLFFTFIRQGKVKVRIMFRDMRAPFIGTQSVNRDDKYFKLYYQFIKHGFGFLQTQDMESFNVRIYLDQLPSDAEQCRRFKQYLLAMPDTQAFQDSALRIPANQIAEVRSHDHVLLQCVDIVLGAMQFRLNDMHLEKPTGATARGKRTIAKEKLYHAIYQEICTIHPRFNIGVSTGARGIENPHWNSPYEHWVFISK